ncbi:2-alkenal reductase [Tanacetum coccineum]
MCRHKNILPFIGYYDDKDAFFQDGVDGDKVILVYKGYYGNLAEYLRKDNKKCNLSWAKRLKICIGIAIDIAYRCISFDLKDRPTMDEVAKTLTEALDIHSKIEAASGAVGQLVGQFAKLLGCYVDGSAGTKEKVANRRNLLNMRLNGRISVCIDIYVRYFPNGIDIYFDNVGGKMLDAVLLNMRLNGRISVCGMISQYNLDQWEGLRNLFTFVTKRVRMEGFIVVDYYYMYPKYLEMIMTLIKQGTVHYIQDIVDGLECAPAALVGLYSGKNESDQMMNRNDVSDTWIVLAAMTGVWDAMQPDFFAAVAYARKLSKLVTKYALKLGCLTRARVDPGKGQWEDRMGIGIMTPFLLRQFPTILQTSKYNSRMPMRPSPASIASDQKIDHHNMGEEGPSKSAKSYQAFRHFAGVRSGYNYETHTRTKSAIDIQTNVRRWIAKTKRSQRRHRIAVIQASIEPISNNSLFTPSEIDITLACGETTAKTLFTGTPPHDVIETIAETVVSTIPHHPSEPQQTKEATSSAATTTEAKPHSAKRSLDKDLSLETKK